MINVNSQGWKERQSYLAEIMTDRWHPMRPCAKHAAFVRDLMETRFTIGRAGRRSGKTEWVKRCGVQLAMAFDSHPSGRFIFGAPTQQQAKDIWWSDLKLLVPDWALLGRRRDAVRESSPQTIRLYNGAELIVAGLDRPQRIEGPPVDWIALDEFADMRWQVWHESVRPAIATVDRPGRAVVIGKPRGRGSHYSELEREASTDSSGEWGLHHWTSAEVLPPEEIESLRRTMDPLTFEQEVMASFVAFEGRAYPEFERVSHCEELPYFEHLPLDVCLDFNRAPGVAVISQEQEYIGRKPYVADDVTAVIGEVRIPRHSTTKRVMNKLAKDWGKHPSKVRFHGDATGGRRQTSSEDRGGMTSSDWDIAETMARDVWEDRVIMSVPRSNPPERDRVNALNCRVMTTDGTIRLLVDPARAPGVVTDFEETVLLEGGSGELDKESNPSATHMTDAIGYYCVAEFPVGGGHYWREEF